jgi:hypothetical protein
MDAERHRDTATIFALYDVDIERTLLVSAGQRWDTPER